MSLINDALKRASEQKAQQSPPAEVSAELQSIDTTNDQARLWPIGLFAVCLVGSLWFGWMWWHGEGTQSAEAISEDTTEVAARSPSGISESSNADQEPAAPTDSSYVTQELPRVERKSKTTTPALAAALPAPPVVPPPAIASVPWSPPVVPPTAAPKPAKVPSRETPNPGPIARTTPATAPAPTSFPSLTLQGIYYRPTRPAAVINARTVYVGDRVLGFSVTAITKNALTLSSAAETKVLSLSD